MSLLRQMNTTDALIIIGREVGQLAAFAALGFAVGLAARFQVVRRMLAWENLKPLLKGCGCLVALVVAFIWILLNGRVFFHRDLLDPPPREIRLVQSAEIDYDETREMWRVTEVAAINSDDVSAYCRPAPQSVDGPNQQRHSHQTEDEQSWLIASRFREIPIVKAQKKLSYPQKIRLTEFSIPQRLKPCLTRHVRIATSASAKLRVPEKTVKSTYPPTEGQRIPGDRVEYAMTVSPGADVEIELIHPWLRNDLGETVMTWNAFAVLKWLVLAIVALFAEQLKTRIVVPLVTLKWLRRRPSSTIGFRPPNKS